MSRAYPWMMRYCTNFGRMESGSRWTRVVSPTLGPPSWWIETWPSSSATTHCNHPRKMTQRPWRRLGNRVHFSDLPLVASTSDSNLALPLATMGSSTAILTSQFWSWATFATFWFWCLRRTVTDGHCSSFYWKCYWPSIIIIIATTIFGFAEFSLRFHYLSYLTVHWRMTPRNF